jgi:hypothetical protein
MQNNPSRLSAGWPRPSLPKKTLALVVEKFPENILVTACAI